MLLKTFSNSSEETKNFEESLENPFYALNLLSKNTDGSYSTIFEPRDSIDIYVLGMCLIEIFESTETNDLLNQNAKRLQMPIGEFLYEVPSITKIFRINETFFYQLLEELITVYPNIFSFTDTAGQKIIELKDPAITSNYFIDQMYQK